VPLLRPVPVPSERDCDDRWLAGRLTAPVRDRAASAAGAAQLDRWLRSRGLSGDPRLPSGMIVRLRAAHPPLVQHVLALNEVTNAGIYACLRMVGYNLEDLPLLQAVLHRDRTVALPAATYNPESRVVWPAAFNENADLTRGEFVSELVSRFDSHDAAEIEGSRASRFLYLRVGRYDTALAPTIVPGSIVQIDTGDCGPSRLISRAARRDRPVFAVAHVRGLACTYVDWLDGGRIALVPTHHLEPPTIYRLDDEAVVLGRVCGELRAMGAVADASRHVGHIHCAGRVTRPDPDRQAFGTFLRSSREAIGMTHRDAHAVSVRIADAYGDRRFAIGIGTLSDWESQRELPLSVPHVISLAVCYSVSFTDLLRASGFRAEERPASPPLAVVGADLTEAPLFHPALLPAVRVAAELPDLTWDDVFRCGDGATVFDSALAGARYLIVNRRDRSVTRALPARSIERALYILSDECGRQICAGCFVDRDQLYIQPDPSQRLSIRAVPRDCIRIRGRVVAILRSR
jgi:hypothetical protein